MTQERTGKYRDRQKNSLAKKSINEFFIDTARTQKRKKKNEPRQNLP